MEMQVEEVPVAMLLNCTVLIIRVDVREILILGRVNGRVGK